MSETQKQSTISVNPETLRFLGLLSNQVRIPRSTIVEELIKAMAQQSVNFEKANCGYWLNVIGDSVIEIRFFGKKKIALKQIPDLPVDSEDPNLTLTKEGEIKDE
jgi:hypothetical protein